MHLALEALGPQAQAADGPRAALGAGSRHRDRQTAVVAVAAMPFAVIHERDAAVGTGERLAAAAAEHHRRCAASVEEQNRLATAVTAVLDGPVEGRRERSHVAGAQLFAQVDNLDRRQRTAGHPRRQCCQLQPAGVRSVERLDPRCRAAQDDGSRGQLAEHQCNLHSVISRHAILLVRGGVLLVDHDDPGPRDRCEDGAA